MWHQINTDKNKGSKTDESVVQCEIPGVKKTSLHDDDNDDSK